MKLKKLEIIGFKSFADRTKLEFSDGITAVVGPNGCGKSNIADAFRWVLGEQSAKSLRGLKMGDVIFAGATNRKPLNYAEVTITLSDIQGKLPVDYEEIAITRKLYRSGESEYLINRIPVRLKDVQGLFLDSSVGKDAYSIFEQGKIDEVINLSPLERRYIFEEASGILRFLQRKKEALRKLEQTDQNVSRVKDIHQEVEKQIIILEEQAEKAKKYKEQKASLEKIEKTVKFSKWGIFKNTFNELIKKSNSQDENIIKANSEIEELQITLVNAKNELSEIEKETRQSGENVFSMRSSKEIKAKERQNQIERLKDLNIKEKRWQQDLESIELKKKERESERQVLKAKEKESSKKLNEIQIDLESQQKVVKEKEDGLAKLRSFTQAKQADMYKLLQTESKDNNQISQSKLRLEGAEEKEKQIQERKKQLSISTKESQVFLDEKQKHLQEALSALDQEKEIFAKMEDELLSISEELEKIQSQMDALNIEFGESRARHKVLKRLKDEMEGFSAGSKKILQAALEKNSPLFGKVKALYEYILPTKGVETTLANACKPYAQTLVVETIKDFDELLTFAVKNKIKDVSFICLETILEGHSSSSKKEILPTFNLLESIKDQIGESQLSNHFLKEMYTAKKGVELQQVIKEFKGIDVFIDDGLMVDRKSVVFLLSQGENNAFMREAEIKALDKKIETLEKDKTSSELVLKATLNKRSVLQKERAELDKKIRQDEVKLVGINFNLQKAKTDLQKAIDEDKTLTLELQVVIDLRLSLSGSLNQLRLQHEKSKREAIDAKESIEQFNRELEKSVSILQELVKLQKAKENLLNHARDEHQKQIHLLHVLEIKDAESLQQVNRLEDEIGSGRLSQEQIEVKKNEIEILLQDVEKGLLQAITLSGNLENQVAAKKNSLEQLEAKINDRRKNLKKCESERNSTSIQSAQVESNMQMLENELMEKHSLTLELAERDYALVGKSIDEAEKEMKILKQEIDAAGDINMTSIEEHSKHKARYEFLNEQIDDLDLSKAELVAIITNLDGESRKLFQETFSKIRVNFKKNFSILFNGGEADLQFTESSDVLEAGIEIVAKPPGKQMGSINLLSGGEKCLTAMALLFAIFEVKPAPFCILDEIDAPLDDINVERFVNIVKLFSENCQFIIITHNKRTMKVADMICGVSMEEKGISKLLTMNFSNKLEPVQIL